MTDLRMALLDLLRKYQDDGQLDVLREGVRLLAQMLMELEVSHQVGAERYERSPQRKTYRNGHREREWDTRVGTIPLRIPKLRESSYFARAPQSWPRPGLPRLGQVGFEK